MTDSDTTRDSGTTPETVKRSDEFPPGIPYIVGNEGAERFSYYGMRAILYVYLAALYVRFIPEASLDPAVADAAKAQATAVAHLFMAGVYAFPMIGAILADRLAGKYPVIFWVSLIYCVGHGVLAVAGRLAEMGSYGGAEYGMYIGLALIAVGSGGIKPCVSANVGDQFSKKNGHLVTKVFQIFYFIINFGSFFATLSIPFVYDKLGAEVAFGIPGILMGIATFVFWLGRNKFTHVPPRPGGRLGGMDFAASVLLFSPVVAIIIAISVFGSHYTIEGAEGLSGLAFYAHYMSGYFGHLASTSWPYFLGAAALFGLGLYLFGRRQSKERDNGFLAVLLYAKRNQHKRTEKMGYFDVARAQLGDDAAEGPPAVLRIMLVFCMVSVFWALFDQHASTWIEQARQMDRTLTAPYWTGLFVAVAVVTLAVAGGIWIFLRISNRKAPRPIAVTFFSVLGATGGAAIVADLIWGKWLTVELQAAQISALNPLMVMIIIPLLNLAVYRPLERRGTPLKPLHKMTIGMFMAAGAFAIAALLQQRMEGMVDSGEQVSVLWQILQYFIMTTAEVLVSVTGLEFAYTQAPRSMKSTIMGFWLLCVTAGNVLVAFLAPMQTILSLSEFFWVFTSLMAVAAVIFAILASFYRGKAYLQHDAA